ncbi:MAG: hypothetical protein KI793_28965 [Rivularia sp. (in: Bacteria)]|nr:hypothetical protein [Rivularia sp. MS3]
MRTNVSPKIFIFLNAVFALIVIGLTAYRTPANFIYRQAFLPKNNVFDRAPIREQLDNPSTAEIHQCNNFR